MFEQGLKRSWWIILFIILCYATYEQAVKQCNKEYQKLSGQLAHLLQEERQATLTHQDLLLQLNSQSDPAWVELTLMKGLGVVPEGQTKVFFLRQKQPLAITP